MYYNVALVPVIKRADAEHAPTVRTESEGSGCWVTRSASRFGSTLEIVQVISCRRERTSATTGADMSGNGKVGEIQTYFMGLEI